MHIDRAKLDAVFADTVKKANKGALSAVIFDGENILYEKHDGYIDKENRIVPAADSLYMIGSNTKVMTTLGLMRLWEDGKLNPGDDIRTYIPEFSVRSRMGDYPFTIEDFLMHRTGLVCDMYRYMTIEKHVYGDIIDGLHHTYRTSLPTEMFSYSNLGFTLLGIVIERISGMKYADFMQKYLFEPLAMEVYFLTETDLPDDVRNRTARNFDGKGKRQNDPLGCCIPAGAHTYTSVRDLAKIGQLLMNKGKYGKKRLYKKKTIEWLEQLPVHDELDRELAVIGHSLFHHKNLSDYQTGPFHGHGGATVYQYSLFDYLPEEKIGIIIFSNFDTALSVINPLERALLNEYLRQAGFAKKETLKRNPVPADITRLVGKYDTGFGPLAFKLSDQGRLVLKAGSLVMKTQTLAEGWIRVILPKPVKDVPADLRVLGKVYLKQAVYFGHKVLIMDNGTAKTVIGCRYMNPDINETWLQAAGSYAPDEGFSERFFEGMDLKLKDGKLILTLKIIGEKLNYYLHVLNDEEAIVKGYGRNCRQTVFLKKEKGYFILECDGVQAKKKIR